MSNPQDNNDAANEELNNERIAGPSESGEIAREAAQIAALQNEVAELKDRYLRAVAETENIRKRSEREKNDAAQFAFSRFAKDLLSVADNFERALDLMKPEKRAALPSDAQSVMDGIEATHRQLGAVFERFGIRRIEAIGQKFNPNLHDAIAEVPSPGHAPGSVIAVAENGYVIGERLLRAAKVAIAAQTSQTSTPGSQAQEPGRNFDTSA
jgi:molecular chaperone GrpE